jgi:hypothetical protein
VLLTVATPGGDTVQATVFVMFWVLPSVKVPVAVSCCVVPLGTVGADGVTAIETRAAEAIVSRSLPAMELELAVMVAVPVACVWTKPVLLTVATPGGDTVQATVFVMFWVLPSVKVPVAVSCCVVPLGTVGADGVTAIETRAAGDTVSAVELLTDPLAAAIVVAPTSSLSASPEVEMVATAGF